MYKEKIFRNGKEVWEIDLHKDGHLFTDNPPPTYQPPHYHGKNGEHFSYKRG